MKKTDQICTGLLVTAMMLLIMGHVAFGRTSSFKYDRVVMYDYSGSKGWYMYIIDEKGQLAKTVTKQVQLSAGEANKLEAGLKSKHSFGVGTAACFEPHLGFVFYKKNKVVKALSICISCNVLNSDVDLPAQKQGKMGHGKDTYYFLSGMSKSFRHSLNDLLIKYKFSHQISPGSAYDK